MKDGCITVVFDVSLSGLNDAHAESGYLTNCRGVKHERQLPGDTDLFFDVHTCFLLGCH